MTDLAFPPLPEDFLRHGMRLALAEASLAAEAGEVPAGCAVLALPDPGDPADEPSPPRVLALAHNRTETLGDATAHAERLAISQAAAATGDWRLPGAVLFVTKEPCPMCAGAIVLARIPVVVYGLPDPRRGGQSVFSILDHPALIHRARLVPGILEDECRAQLTGFFRERRAGLLGKPVRDTAIAPTDPPSLYSPPTP